jgi:hypothetical protein
MTRFAPGALALAGWLASFGTATAQQTATAPKELAGLWAGTLKVNDQISFRLALRVENGTAVIDSLDQGVKGIAVSSVALDKGKVRLESQPIRATYEGQLDEKAGAIRGTWTQPGGSWPLTLKRARAGDAAIANPAAPRALEGRWTGTLKVNDQISFRLALRVEEGKAAIDSLDQNVNGIPVTSITLEKDQLRFENKGILASFKGQLDEKAGTISGTWTQPGGSWPLTFTKAK